MITGLTKSRCQLLSPVAATELMTFSDKDKLSLRRHYMYHTDTCEKVEGMYFQLG